MEKQITANEVREFFRKRDKEISETLWKTNTELSRKVRETEDAEMLSELAIKAMSAQKKGNGGNTGADTSLPRNRIYVYKALLLQAY